MQAPDQALGSMLISEKPPATVSAAIHFLKPDDLHEREKPYAFRYGIDSSDIQQSNMEMEKVENITITNIRGLEDQFSIGTNGFAVLKINDQLKYEDYWEPSRLSTYFGEVETLLKAYLGARHVEVFRSGLRKRHPDFPISTGKEYDFDQPTSVAHIDTTPDETKEEVQRQHGTDLSELLRCRTQWINVWKPLKGPLNDWPLTFCDASSIEPNHDLEAADIIYPDLVTENYQVYYRPEHKWYFLSDQEVNEAIVFKQADLITGSCPGVPHCSFLNPLTPKHEAPRESIELRALVYYDM